VEVALSRAARAGFAIDGTRDSAMLRQVTIPVWLRALSPRERLRGSSRSGRCAWLCALGVALGACSHTKHSSSAASRGAVGPSEHAATAATHASLNMVKPPSSQLSFSVRDADTHQPIPCKLTFIGVSGSRDPAFSRNDKPESISAGVAAFNRIFSLGGAGTIRVPRGTYDVYVSRGPEWSLHVERGLKVGPRGAHLQVALSHVVDTTGWLSGDFHVHAARSFDSVVPMAARVEQFAADGVELIVSTDHNTLSDYAPVIERLRAGRYITSAIGEEITTHIWGHYGAFPLERHPDQPGAGAIPVHGRTPNQIFADVRSRYPLAIINVNHPHFGRIGYFDEAKLDPARAEFRRPGASFNFDAMELLNGYRDGDKNGVRAVLSDWFQLLDHGYRFTATGDSDTHHLTLNQGGYPRNYLRVDDDRPSALTPRILSRTLKAGRSFLSTGPFVRLSVGGGQLGDTVEAAGGKVTGQLEVQAAPWIDVKRIFLFVNGHVAEHWIVPHMRNVTRLDARFEIQVDHDAYVVALVQGDRPLAPIAGEFGGFRVYPVALTNPIFVDVDGNGKYDAPLATGQ
jgi:hypothetical protein